LPGIAPESSVQFGSPLSSVSVDETRTNQPQAGMNWVLAAARHKWVGDPLILDCVKSITLELCAASGPQSSESDRESQPHTGVSFKGE
jgi:hypothetical protein